MESEEPMIEKKSPPATTYFSVDIETDGLAPGLHSMLSLGCVAYGVDYADTGALSVMALGEISINFDRLPGATVCTKTMTEFWDRFPEQHAATRRDLHAPGDGIRAFRDWIAANSPNASKRDRIFVASPSSFDMSFVSYYSHRFLKEDLFHYVPVDLSSLLAGFQRSEPSQVRLHDYALSKGITQREETKHIALPDAQYQGQIFRVLYNEIADENVDRAERIAGQ
jgi:DNA polymerase III alpha subunit (gram-positive type)